MNVARLQTLIVNGRERPTGIFKEPIEGRVAVGELGVEGDVQADRRVHGGPDQAVYAYAIEDVEWWESELGRELGPGFFGENLTLRGVDVTGASTGDRWRAGGVTLEVTFPRTPCQKLAKKSGQPGFVKRFAKAGRPGMYLRVVEAGDLAAGDPVELGA